MSPTPQQSIGGGSKLTGPPQQARPKDKNSIRPQIPSGRTWLWLVAVLATNYLMVRLLFPAPRERSQCPTRSLKNKSLREMSNLSTARASRLPAASKLR